MNSGFEQRPNDPTAQTEAIPHVDRPAWQEWAQDDNSSAATEQLNMGVPQLNSPQATPWQQSNRMNAGAEIPLSPAGPAQAPPPQPDQFWQFVPPETPAPQPNPAWHPGGPQHPPTSTYAIPPFEPPPPARNRMAWVFAGVGAVVAVALAVTVALIVSGRNSSDSGSTAGGPSMVSALTTGKGTPAANRPSATRPVPSGAAAAPLVPGYQVVPIPERGAAYDAPPEWKVDPLGTAVWGHPPETVEIAGLAQDGKDYCPRYTRTNAFLTMSPQADPAAAAADVGVRMARVGWSATVGATPGSAENLTSLDGQLQGAFVETTGTAPPPAPGCAATFSVFTFAFPSENGNFVMTIAADTGVPQAVDRATAKQVLASIRPLPDR
ncbi:hypothetical protein [Nocardia wallacei]|uniref:hypothetical protein n=1 Tax=Nocardia wallacei TaxID=480035 RepID=UPI0024572356|nr:hypothetical protein [Nocardia wallacei]